MSIARHVGLTAPVVAWLLLAVAVPGSAFAQSADKGPSKAERATARDAYNQGTASFEHGDYVTALDSFVKANALIPSVQAMYWIAQAQDKLGHTDAAIEAYEAIVARADFNKLSEDKAATVRARLAALKPAPPPPAPEPAPAEPAPAAPVAPPQSVVTATPAPAAAPSAEPVDASTDLRPQRNAIEVGVLGGALFVSDSNNLQAGGKSHENFDPAVQIGIRAAFFPLKEVGVEAEWAHGFSHWSCSGAASCSPAGVVGPMDGSANFDVVRGHLIGQLPISRWVPFALLGAGLLHEQSDATGSDNDLALEGGVGLKFMATRLLVPRIDARVSMTQKQGGTFADGIALHPELLLGLSFVLGG